MAVSNIVFLICSERSGSNLIRAIAGAHSDIHAPPPLHLWQDIFTSIDWSGLALGENNKLWKLLQRRINRRLEKSYDAELPHNRQQTSKSASS